MIKELKEKIEGFKSELSRLEGEEAKTRQDLEKMRAELCKVLGCERGGEKAAIEELRSKRDSLVSEVEGMLSKLEEDA